jgi:peptidoglycan/LPS O-acetylase OafA/YrhL
MKRSGTLDLVRGLAAVLVMLGHLRGVFLPPFQELSHQGVVERLFYFITGFGHQCVIVFFALSGYFVGAAYHRKFNEESIDGHTKKYALNRIARLWTVLIPALLFTALMDTLGQSLHGGASVYNTSNYFEFIPLSNDRTVGTFFGNLFFVQTIIVPTFGTNGPLWSLANEFWYYLLFPALYLLFVKRIGVAAKMLLALGSAAILYWIGRYNTEMLEGFLVWLLGFGVYMISKKPGMLLRIACILLFGILFGLSRVMAIPHSMLVVGLAANLLILAIRDLDLKWFDKTADFLARISYTLYLVHLPLIIFVYATLLNNVDFDGNLPGMLFVVAAALVTIAFSYVMYWLFERRTDDVRAFVSRFLFRSR